MALREKTFGPATVKLFQWVDDVESSSIQHNGRDVFSNQVFAVYAELNSQSKFNCVTRTEIHALHIFEQICERAKAYKSGLEPDFSIDAAALY